eukprot:SAG11_NODE_919_length_6545_cov_5.571052_7_plen_51_part_00
MSAAPNIQEAEEEEAWRQSPATALAHGKALQKAEQWEDACEAFGVALELG